MRRLIGSCVALLSIFVSTISAAAPPVPEDLGIVPGQSNATPFFINGEGRVTGLALGATSATAIFGGLAPYAAQLLTERSGLAVIPGAMIAVVALCVLPVVLRLPSPSRPPRRARPASTTSR